MMDEKTRFVIVVREVLEREVEVYANTEEEAEEIVVDRYDMEDIVLDSRDFKEVTFDVKDLSLETSDEGAEEKLDDLNDGIWSDFK